MLELLSDFFSGKGFMPHGHCYLWSPGILWTHVVSDVLISLSYFSIPISLFFLMKSRDDLRPFRTTFWLFILFIMFCGMTHLMEIYTVWHPSYALSGGVKAATALVSVATAVSVWPLLPLILKIPSNNDLISINEKLQAEIVERKKVEAELKEHKMELEKLVSLRTSALSESYEKLKESNADLEQFAYAASHDLQEPLRMVSSYVGLIEEKLAAGFDEESSTYFKFAKDGAVRMSDLIRDLLNFSRIGRQVTRLIEFDFALIINDMNQLFMQNHPEVRHVVDAPSSFMVSADMGQLKIVLQNLYSNAFKYRRDGHDLKIKIGVEEDDKEWIVHFSDNGIGFNTKYKDIVFQVFKRLHTKSTYPGTGIGLSICKRVIERHGGRIWVDSAVNIGTAFHFTIPKPKS